MSWLLWIVLQCTLGCTCLFEFWFSTHILLKVGLLAHMVALFLPFKGTSIVFSILAVTNYIPPVPQEGPLFLTPILAFIASHSLTLLFPGAYILYAPRKKSPPVVFAFKKQGHWPINQRQMDAVTRLPDPNYWAAWRQLWLFWNNAKESKNARPSLLWSLYPGLREPHV